MRTSCQGIALTPLRRLPCFTFRSSRTLMCRRLHAHRTEMRRWHLEELQARQIEVRRASAALGMRRLIALLGNRVAPTAQVA